MNSSKLLQEATMAKVGAETGPGAGAMLPEAGWVEAGVGCRRLTCRVLEGRHRAGTPKEDMEDNSPEGGATEQQGGARAQEAVMNQSSTAMQGRVWVKGTSWLPHMIRFKKVRLATPTLTLLQKHTLQWF